MENFERTLCEAIVDFVAETHAVRVCLHHTTAHAPFCKMIISTHAVTSFTLLHAHSYTPYLRRFVYN